MSKGVLLFLFSRVFSNLQHSMITLRTTFYYIVGSYINIMIHFIVCYHMRHANCYLYLQISTNKLIIKNMITISNM